MHRVLLLILGIVLIGCVRPEERVLPYQEGIVFTPQAEARLARYNGMQMRARAFSKHNGPKQLRATSAMQFERTASGLRLAKRTDILGKVYIGEGVELVGGSAHAEEYPPCEVGVPMEEQTQLPCIPPPCEDVNNVEPCEPPGDPEDPPGEPGIDIYTTMVTDTVLLTGMAQIYTTSTTFTPTAQDSIHADSVAIFLADTLDATFGVLVEQDGRPIGGFADMGDGLTVGVDLAFEGSDLASTYLNFVTEFGDTVIIEVTQELSEWQLRSDALALSLAYQQSITARLASWLGPCGGEFILFMSALTGTAVEVGKIAFAVAQAVNPAMKGYKALKSGLAVVSGMFTGIAAHEVRSAQNIGTLIRRAILDFSGVSGIASSVSQAAILGGGALGALMILDNCLESPV